MSNYTSHLLTSVSLPATHASNKSSVSFNATVGVKMDEDVVHNVNIMDVNVHHVKSHVMDSFHDNNSSHLLQPDDPQTTHRTGAHHPLWLLMLMVHAVGTRGAVAGLLSMGCTSVCGHGICLYPLTLSSKATVSCHCHRGWGGDQCTIPCSRSCGNHGDCVFVGDMQVCLCHVGYVGLDCGQPGYDIVTLLSLAELMNTGPPLLTSPASSPLASAELHGKQNVAGGAGALTANQDVSAVVSATELKSKATLTVDGRQLTATTSSETSVSLSSSSVQSSAEVNTSSVVQDAVDASLSADSGLASPSPSPFPSFWVSSTWEMEGVSVPSSSVMNVPIVENAREQVERNVEQGSHQCMNNFVCRNGGRCVSGTFGGFRCLCKPPFFGVFCENTCSKPCYNGGRCLKLRHRPREGGDGSGSEGNGSSGTVALSVSGYRYVYRCVCPRQFYGEQCERKTQT